jgi:probable phosphoglycerate mutase
MKLYFVRHGESEANILQEVSNREFKHPLTDKGREQASTLAQNLQAMGIPVARLFTSPLMRAVQTAEILSAALGLPYEMADALREFDCGILEGLSDDECWQMHYALRVAWFEAHRWEQRIEGGESFFDIRDRFVPFIDGVIRDYRDGQDNIMLVGHGGTYGCMLPLILNNVGSNMLHERGFPNTGAVIAEWTPDGLTCLSWCGDPVAPNTR